WKRSPPWERPRSTPRAGDAMCLRDLRQDREKESNPARPGVRTCGAGRTSALQTARLIADGDHPGKSNLADSPPRSVGLDLVGEPVGDPLHIIVRQDRPGTHLDQPAKPGALALRELARPRADPLHRLRQAGLAFQHRDDLAISHALRGHCTEGARRRPQGANFLDEPRVEHRCDPAIDPVVKFGAGPFKREDQGPRGSGTLMLDLEPAERLTGQLDQLQRSDDPPPVVGMKPRGGRRIDSGEPSMQRLRATLLGLAFQAKSKCGVRPWTLKQPSQQGLQIQGRAAHEENPLASPFDVLDGCQGPPSILGDAGRLPRIEHINQVMGNSPALGVRRLGRANVQAAVKCHRIYRDDLRVQPASQRDTDRCLPRSRWTGQIDRTMQRLKHHSPTFAMIVVAAPNRDSAGHSVYTNTHCAYNYFGWGRTQPWNPGSCHCIAVVLDLIRGKFDTVRISSRRMLCVGLLSD